MECENKTHNTLKFNAQLKEAIPFFSKMHQMMPWVGKEYEKGTQKRVLFVGESHYLPEKKDWQEEWYILNAKDLMEKEFKWTFTSRIVGKVAKGESRAKAHSIYKNIERGVREHFDVDRLFRKMAFYNFFLRPAMKPGESINPTEKDQEVAYQSFYGIIKVLKPELIFITSKKVWNHLKEQNMVVKDDPVEGEKRVTGIPMGLPIDRSPHPGCRWWHELHGKDGRSGKARMIDFLETHNAFT